MPIDMNKSRREGMRWYVLLALHRGEPVGCGDTMLRDIMDDIYDSVTPNELQQQLNYLERCLLVTIERSPLNKWHGKLTAAGIDFVEYVSDDRKGIKRPKPATSW